jgi:hypothetical protein
VKILAVRHYTGCVIRVPEDVVRKKRAYLLQYLPIIECGRKRGVYVYMYRLCRNTYRYHHDLYRVVSFMLFISVHMINIAKQIQLMHTIIYLSFCLTSPRHVSASNCAIIKRAISKLHKVCMNVTIKY